MLFVRDLKIKQKIISKATIINLLLLLSLVSNIGTGNFYNIMNLYIKRQLKLVFNSFY